MRLTKRAVERVKPTEGVRLTTRRLSPHRGPRAHDLLGQRQDLSREIEQFEVVLVLLPNSPPLLIGDHVGRVEAWTAKELARFLERVSSQRLYPLWRLAATMGMRRGELLGLTWRCLDLEGARLSVEQQLLPTRSGLSFGPPKVGTFAARRRPRREDGGGSRGAPRGAAARACLRRRGLRR